MKRARICLRDGSLGGDRIVPDDGGKYDNVVLYRIYPILLVVIWIIPLGLTKNAIRSYIFNP